MMIRSSAFGPSLSSHKYYYVITILFFAVESVKFERPLVTDMHVAGQQRFNGIKHGWTSAHNEEDSMEVKEPFSWPLSIVMLFCL